MIPLTRHGWREMLVGAILLLIIAAGLALIWHPLALLVVPFLVFLFSFFRDPHRPLPPDPLSVVSPADGMVSDITELDHYDLLGGPAVRIGIFLSVLNVHVNRSPLDGRIISTHYKKGKFINALHHDEASTQNESNTILIGDSRDQAPIAVVKQIVGLIARRIVCTVSPGDTVARGQRIGMIKFGSRTELYLPRRLGPAVKVSVGDKVRGAADVIAVLAAKPT